MNKRIIVGFQSHHPTSEKKIPVDPRAHLHVSIFFPDMPLISTSLFLSQLREGFPLMNAHFFLFRLTPKPHHASLLALSEHDNRRDLVLPHHGPEIQNGVQHRALSGDERLVVAVSLGFTQRTKSTEDKDLQRVDLQLGTVKLTGWRHWSNWN